MNASVRAFAILVGVVASGCGRIDFALHEDAPKPDASSVRDCATDSQWANVRDP
jgi:hypothetical protein